MTTGSILLGLALVVIVGLYVARPLMAPKVDSRAKESLYNDLLANKEFYLIQIKSLELDYSTGKIPEEEYQQQRAALVAEAAATLKRIDEIEAATMQTELQPEASLEPFSPEMEVDADIEAAVSRLRRSHHAPASTGLEQELAAPVALSAERNESKFCPQCGQATDPGDKFCVNCGTKIKYPQPV
ncbi:MAG TPA: zinc ribbon domain-containing protein [candidate division Zixibacteria bacterium]|nr:zinc ribbon domain-containing protein [candidate division Zixibacteria bacterium]